MNSEEIRTWALSHGYSEEDLTPEFEQTVAQAWDLVQRAVNGDTDAYIECMEIAYGDW